MEILVTDSIIVAERSAARCMRCGKKTVKGEPILRRGMTTKYGYQMRSVCFRCANKALNQEEEEMKKSLKENKNLKKDLKNKMRDCAKVILANSIAKDATKTA